MDTMPGYGGWGYVPETMPDTLNMRLFWCSTEDHEEDWFVVADAEEGARQAFSEHAGYDLEEISVRPLERVPERALDAFKKRLGTVDAPPLADLSLLKSLGGELLSVRSPYVVRFARDIFVEGSPDLERYQKIDDALEAIGRGRPNGTRRRAPLQ